MSDIQEQITDGECLIFRNRLLMLSGRFLYMTSEPYYSAAGI